MGSEDMSLFPRLNYRFLQKSLQNIGMKISKFLFHRPSKFRYFHMDSVRREHPHMFFRYNRFGKNNFFQMKKILDFSPVLDLSILFLSLENSNAHGKRGVENRIFEIQIINSDAGGVGLFPVY